MFTPVPCRCELVVQFPAPISSPCLPCFLISCKALNFQGRLKQLLGQQKRASDMSLEPLPLALFAIVTPFQPFSILKLQTKMLFFQSKHKLDFTPIACDSWYGISCLHCGKTHGHKCRTESQSATGCPCFVLCPQGEGRPGLHRSRAVQ